MQNASPEGVILGNSAGCSWKGERQIIFIEGNWTLHPFHSIVFYYIIDFSPKWAINIKLKKNILGWIQPAFPPVKIDRGNDSDHPRRLCGGLWDQHRKKKKAIYNGDFNKENFNETGWTNQLDPPHYIQVSLCMCVWNKLVCHVVGATWIGENYYDIFCIFKNQQSIKW